MSFVETAQRSRSQQHGRSDYAGAQQRGPSFHHPRTSLGATGHWIHIAAIAAPLVIGELVQDSDKRWHRAATADIRAPQAALGSFMGQIWDNGTAKQLKKLSQLVMNNSWDKSLFILRKNGGQGGN